MTENDEGSTKKKAVANAREIEHKGSSDLEFQPPEVCETPSAPEEIPIPYPNVAKASDTSEGPKKVRTNGEMVSTKAEDYEKSTGDEAGSDQERSWSAVEPTTTKSLPQKIKDNPLLMMIIMVVIIILVLVAVDWVLRSPTKILPADGQLECIQRYLTQTPNS